MLKVTRQGCRRCHEGLPQPGAPVSVLACWWCEQRQERWALWAEDEGLPQSGAAVSQQVLVNAEAGLVAL